LLADAVFAAGGEVGQDGVHGGAALSGFLHETDLGAQALDLEAARCRDDMVLGKRGRRWSDDEKKALLGPLEEIEQLGEACAAGLGFFGEGRSYFEAFAFAVVEEAPVLLAYPASLAIGRFAEVPYRP